MAKLQAEDERTARAKYDRLAAGAQGQRAVLVEAAVTVEVELARIRRDVHQLTADVRDLRARGEASR